MIHVVVRFGYGEVAEVECECGWQCAASNPIPLFEEWHEHRVKTEDDNDDS